jgi:hypothetical protein
MAMASQDRYLARGVLAVDLLCGAVMSFKEHKVVKTYPPNAEQAWLIDMK